MRLLAVAGLCAIGAHAALTSHVPIGLHIPGVKGGADPMAEATVTVCNLDWAGYRADPAKTPMFRDLLSASGCTMQDRGADTHSVSFLELEKEFEERCPQGVDTAGVLGCTAAGFVFHESRCGSTLVANMLAALPDTVTYSECQPLHDVLTSERLSDEQKVRVLRVVVAAMARPIAVHAAGQPVPRGDAGWTPQRIFYKMQSALGLYKRIFREAFPTAPWLFVHREPAEVLASLLRNAATLPPPDSPPSVHLDAGDHRLKASPCMRNHDKSLPPALLASLGVTDEPAARLVPPEDFCAANVALYCASALYGAVAARTEALIRVGVLSDKTKSAVDLLDGEAVAAAVKAAAAKGAVVVRDGQLLDPATMSGTIAGVGQALFIDYSELPEGFVDVLNGHFRATPGAATPRPPGPEGDLSEAAIARLAAVSQKYSKARTGAGSGGISTGGLLGMLGGAGGGVRGGGGGGGKRPAPLIAPSMDSSGKFIEDSEHKQARAWPALKLAADRYLRPLRLAMLRFNAGVSGIGLLEAAEDSGSAGGAGGSGDSSQWAVHVDAAVAIPPEHVLPLGAGYPMLFPLTDILSYWNADIITPPPDYGRYSSLRVFDWTTEKAEAEAYRRAEVPFIVRNVPALETAAEMWADDEYLKSKMNPGGAGGGDRVYDCEVNKGSNHFMYYNKGKAHREKNYKPPTEEAKLTIGEWLKQAHAVQEAVVAEEAANLPGWWWGASGGAADTVHAKDLMAVAPPERASRTLYYLRSSTNARNPHENAWIKRDLTFFEVEQDREAAKFFLVDPSQQRGIHCRFGSAGIIAESHYDGGRNFISMERGHKRYILSPPSECANLALLKDGPSARHSHADWTSPADMPLLKNALATEVVMQAGDVLYVPSLWFHYITSLDVNIQCNTRSGTPPLYAAEIQACGFDAMITEAEGAFTDPKAAQLQPNRAQHEALWKPYWTKREVADVAATSSTSSSSSSSSTGSSGGAVGQGEGGGSAGMDAATADAAVRTLLQAYAASVGDTAFVTAPAGTPSSGIGSTHEKQGAEKPTQTAAGGGTKGQSYSTKVTKSGKKSSSSRLFEKLMKQEKPGSVSTGSSAGSTATGATGSGSSNSAGAVSEFAATMRYAFTRLFVVVLVIGVAWLARFFWRLRPQKRSAGPKL